MTTNIPDFQAAEAFLSVVAEEFTPTFQYFYEGGENGGSFPGHITAPFERVKNILAKKNIGEGCGIYLMVNEGDGKGRKEENVLRVNALFVDLDGAPLDPVLRAALKPHVITNTSHGRYQAFWLVKNCPLDAFKRAQLALAVKFQGDIKVHDLSRVMRLPGFVNNKPGKEGHKVTITDIEYGQPYDFQHFWESMDLSSMEATLLGEDQSREKLPPLDELLQGEIPSGSRNHTLMRYAGRYVFHGCPEDVVFGILSTININCCKPPLAVQEVKSIAKSAMTYAVPKVDFTALINNSNKGDGENEDGGDTLGSLAIARELVLGAPGLVGSIAAWITSVSYRQQPHFSLAGALAFVGALKGHRFQTESGMRSNIMTLAIGKTGSGKSEVGEKIELLIGATSLNHLAMGVPGSDSGLRVALHQRKGQAYLYWDEMGLALEGMLAKNASQFHKGIKDLLIELYSKSATILRAKELASELGRKQNHDILQPHLCLFANAQADIFYSALSSSHASDGFYPRLLVFETDNHYPEGNEGRNSGSSMGVPERLVEAILRVEDSPFCEGMTGNMAANGQKTAIEPRVVKYSSGARRLLEAARSDFQRKLSQSKDGVAAGILARSVAHIEKVALIVSGGEYAERLNWEITGEEMSWSIDLVVALAGSMTPSFEMRVSDSAVEKTKKKVAAILYEAGPEGLSQRELTRRTQWIRDSRERLSILRDLEDAGLVREKLVQGKTRPATYWVSRRA